MKKQKLEQGSMTVEAVFVFPIIIFVLIAILYMSHYMADKCKGQSIIDLYAQEQALCLKGQYPLETSQNYTKILEKGVYFYLSSLTKEETELDKQVREQLAESLLMGEVSSVAAKVSYNSIIITAKIKLTIGISRVKEFFTGTPLEYTIDTKIPVHNPEEFIRAYTALAGTMDEGKGEKSIKKKLREIKGKSKNSHEND